MWVVALGMMAIVFFGGGHFFHSSDDGHGKRQAAATAELEPVHKHSVADKAVDPDKENYGHGHSSGQVPGSDAGGPPDACTGDPENPGAQGDECS